MAGDDYSNSLKTGLILDARPVVGVPLTTDFATARPSRVSLTIPTVSRWSSERLRTFQELIRRALRRLILSLILFEGAAFSLLMPLSIQKKCWGPLPFKVQWSRRLTQNTRKDAGSPDACGSKMHAAWSGPQAELNRSRGSNSDPDLYLLFYFGRGFVFCGKGPNAVVKGTGSLRG